MSVDIVKNLLKEASEVAWASKKIQTIENSHKRRASANQTAMKAAKCTLDLNRIGREEIAIETGVTSAFLFLLGGHYGQVLSSAEALHASTENTRFEEDIEYYIKEAEVKLREPDVSSVDGRLDALYSLVWKYGILGTTEAMNELYERFDLKKSNPTINSYSSTLYEEKRIFRLGGPTGYRIEMFVNQTVSLSRKLNYGKVAFFEGNLVEQGPNAFERLWTKSMSHRKVYAIENGNDPKTYAIVEPDSVYDTKALQGGLGVLGDLFPLKHMPDYGFKPYTDVGMADFLVNCSLKSHRGG